MKTPYTFTPREIARALKAANAKHWLRASAWRPSRANGLLDHDGGRIWQVALRRRTPLDPPDIAPANPRGRANVVARLMRKGRTG